jgi:hypothetical protein
MTAILRQKKNYKVAMLMCHAMLVFLQFRKMSCTVGWLYFVLLVNLLYNQLITKIHNFLCLLYSDIHSVVMSGTSSSHHHDSHGLMVITCTYTHQYSWSESLQILQLHY